MRFFHFFHRVFHNKKGIIPIHTVIQARSFLVSLGKNAGILPFIKRKSKDFLCILQNRSERRFVFLNLE